MKYSLKFFPRLSSVAKGTNRGTFTLTTFNPLTPSNEHILVHFTLDTLLLKQRLNLSEATFNTLCWEIDPNLQCQHVSFKAPVPKCLHFWNLTAPTTAMC